MSINKKSKIGVLCGGISNEREISIRSGKNCFNALLRLGYENTILIDIKSENDLFNLKNKIEIAFLTTHGKYGEDGALQGVLDWLQIPYSGSSLLACALSMDKFLTKQIAKSNNIPTAQCELITLGNIKNIDLENIWQKLSEKNGAVFLKPNDDGSSVNTFKIKSFNELTEKINNIDLSKSNYLIEEYIKGKEITMSLIEKDSLIVLPALELIPKNEFYDYEAKYTKGMTEFILPANIDTNTKNKLEKYSLEIFKLLGCSSFGRVDFILDDHNIPYLLEVNLLPGMTDTSDLPAQAKCAGIEYDELVEIILKTAKIHR